MNLRALLSTTLAAAALVALLSPGARAAIGNKQKFGFNLQKTCNGCHGSLAGNWWPDGTVRPDIAGAHQKHVDAIFARNSATLQGANDTDKKNNTCDWCHPNPGNSRAGTSEVKHDDAGAPADVHGDGRSPATPSNFKNIIGGANGVQGTYSTATKTCANVDCHYRTTTTAWDVGVLACNGCHGVGATAGTLPPAHPKHVAASPAGEGYPCGYCHLATASYTNAHGNWAVEIQFVDLPALGKSGTELYSLGTPQSVKFAAGSGVCLNVKCHGAGTVAGPGAPNWAGGPLAGKCFDCHDINAATVVENGGVLGGVADYLPNEVDKAQYENTGHGLLSTGKYDKNALNDAQGNAGANLVVDTGCYNCHDSAAQHVPQTSAADPLRVGSANQDNLNNVCLQSGTCHGPDLGKVINHHSDTVVNNAKTGYSFQAKCIDCHDPHGDSNMFMVHSQVHVDGPDADAPQTMSSTKGVPDATRAVTFTAAINGSDFANTNAASTGPFTGICEVCHDQTSWYRGTTAGAANGPRTGHLMTSNCASCHLHEKGFGAACDGCHGYPPVPPSQTPVVRQNAPRERIETDPTGYAGGGGVHRSHVNPFWKMLDPTFDPTSATAVPTVDPDPKVLCGPCHGDDPGSATWHNEAATVLQTNVDIRTRNIAGFSWGTGAKYEALDLSGPGIGGHVAVGGNQQCTNLDCHGRPDPAKAATPGPQSQGTENARAHFPELLSWQDTISVLTDGTGTDQVSKKTVVCKWCHDETAAHVVVKNGAGTGDVYNSPPARDAATAYFRPLSGYGRGGHGDSKIQDEQPFVNSDASHATPIACEACHTDTALHFGPKDAANLHRLTTPPTIEDTSHSSSGLCNSCHAGSSYTGGGAKHHPSLQGTAADSNRSIVVSASQEVWSAVNGSTRWVDPSGADCGAGDAFCEQTAYGAANYSGDPDHFINWWGGAYGTGNQSPPPRPVFYGEATSASPKAILPLRQFVGNQSGATDAVMCVTCHNPHGTDLYTYDPVGGGQSIPDNNMLRLRDEDNVLCNACH